MDDTVVAAFALGHGADPSRELARLGYAGALRRAALDRARPERLVLAFTVSPTTVPIEQPAPVRADEGLVLAPGEQPHRHQRTAAYGIVTSVRGLLLTQLSDQTNAAGFWGLPGGGMDPGEQPLDTLHREVHEESGQVVTHPELVEVLTSHWVGRAPGGRLEDFQAVRIIYRAQCPDPTDPVVHDIGGSTSAAAWFTRAELDHLPIGGSFSPHLERWLGPTTGAADGVRKEGGLP